MTLSPSILTDQIERDRIARELQTTFLVEAAAGTGKTTCLVKRMVALIRTGTCTVNTLAAVTFTRKAAAELRDRFRRALEETRQTCASSAEITRLEQAMNDLDQGYIGTIHSFCALMLRERPIEAGIDPGFTEIETDEDDAVRRDAWKEYAATLIASNNPRLATLMDLGIELHDLEDAFVQFANFPDVGQHWPIPSYTPVNTTQVVGAIDAYLARLRAAISYPVAEQSEDAIREAYLDKFRLLRFVNTADRVHVMRFVATLSKSYISVPQAWGVGRNVGKPERDCWEAFIDGAITPALDAWYAERYAAIIPVFREAVTTYDTMRREHGVLNFQDLLMRAAVLLHHVGVRRYFRQRFTHLLVDEFQDTDPIQAEVMLLLTADDPSVQEWRACTPCAGSLFVVGDPKQSIYRFRRADIVTYNLVKARILATGGEVLTLTSNFRTVPSIMDWINTTFAGIFPATSSDESPAHVALTPARIDAVAGEPPLQQILLIGDDVYTTDAYIIANAIKRMIDAHIPIERANGDNTAARYEDFLILNPYTSHIGQYADALQARSIPHQVTGGDMLNTVPVLRWLYLCVNALMEPDNPVALVALLRSELCGISDVTLYDYQQAGGRFQYRAVAPTGFPAIKDAFDRLQRYALWCSSMLPMAALERIVDELTLIPWAAAGPNGIDDAGSVFKALALIREQAQIAWTLAEIVEYLRQMAYGEAKQDGAPLLPEEENVVRVMNMHQAKGLEAPVVFLAAPQGQNRSYPIQLYVDRQGGTIEGYMAVYGKKQEKSRKHPELIACPSGWGNKTEIEKRFEEAEKNRLLYVAATRAGAHLIISRIDGKTAFFWHKLASKLTAGTLPDQATPVTPRQSTPLALSTQDVTSATAAITASWQARQQPTYAITSVRASVLDETELIPGGIAGGAAFGRVIHRLLQNLLQQPSIDLAAESSRIMAEECLEADRHDEVLAAVNTARQTDIWRRACAAPRRLLESPLAVRQIGVNGIPIIIGGVVDLAFEETGEWVLVDYKSDDTPGRSLDQLTAHYTPQLVAYAEAWSSLIPMKEIGLLFVRTGTYRDISAALPVSTSTP